MSVQTNSGGRYFGAVAFGQYAQLIVQTGQDITGISCIGAAVVVTPATAVTITGRAYISNYVWLIGDKRIKGIAMLAATGPTGPTGPGATGTTGFTGGTSYVYFLNGRACISNNTFLGIREKVISAKACITSLTTASPPSPDPGTSPVVLANLGLVIYINGRSRISSPALEVRGARIISGVACIKL